MVQIEYKCFECNNVIQANIYQSSIDWQLRWSSSYECPYCASINETDDIGFPPQAIRQKIIDEEGEWQLRIDERSSSGKIKALKIIRQILNLSIKEASELIRDYSKIAKGTKTEMNWLKKRLLENNIQSKVEKKE